MNIQLRSYQNECQAAVFRDIEAGNEKLACVLPTGSGKTTIFGSIVAEYTKRNPNKRAIVVSHLGLLVSQTGARFEEEWGVKTGILQANKYPHRDDKVVMTTMQSIRELDKIMRWAGKHGFFCASPEKLDVGLIIIDEAHYAGSASYQKIMSHFPDAIVLGFTATPFRENKLMTNLFDKVSYTTSMQDMIDQGYLVPPKLNQVPFDTTDQAEMFAMMLKIYKEKHSGQKAVIYLKTIEEAKLCRNIFVDSGVTCSAVTSELTGSLRDELLADFRAGKGPDVLTTVDVLTAGFDSPNLSALFIPYRVGSVTVYLQRVGRGLRPYPGKSYCDIYAGSVSPGIEKGFWEEMTKKMLIQGRPKQDYEDLRDLLEYADLSKEEYTWTKDVLDMAGEVKKKGMGNIFDLIVTQKFPEYMLSTFVDSPPQAAALQNSKQPATPKQMEWIRKMGVDTERLTKQEASAIIMAHKRANGTIPDDEIIKTGKHAGKHFSEVPLMYWNILRKNAPSSGVYKAYIAYKDKWRRR